MTTLQLLNPFRPAFDALPPPPKLKQKHVRACEHTRKCSYVIRNPEGSLEEASISRH